MAKPQGSALPIFRAVALVTIFRTGLSVSMASIMYDTEIRGRTFKIEVLHSVRGLPKSADVEAVVLDVEGFRIRVPRPSQLLEAKLDNVAHLDQSERQDLRHGQILTLCTREFLHDVPSPAESGAISDWAAAYQRKCAEHRTDREPAERVLCGGSVPCR